MCQSSAANSGQCYDQSSLQLTIIPKIVLPNLRICHAQALTSSISLGKWTMSSLAHPHHPPMDPPSGARTTPGSGSGPGSRGRSCESCVPTSGSRGQEAQRPRVSELAKVCKASRTHGPDRSRWQHWRWHLCKPSLRWLAATLVALILAHVFASSTAALEGRKGARAGGKGGNFNQRPKCPNCMKPTDEQQRQAADNMRIEAIKLQILSKLGLKHKPNITKAIPREIVLDTLWRADEGMDLLNPRIQGNRPKVDTGDDYYARTSEIITFAEPGGSLNGQTMLQFSNRHDNPHGLRVKSATLWVQLKFRTQLARHFRHVFHDRKITLYVFRVVGVASANFTSVAGGSGSSSSSSITLELITSIRMSIKHVGWKKFDLQETVQKWFGGPLGQRLSLLIDCAGCGSLVQPIFFAEDATSKDSRRHLEAAARGYRPFLAIVTEPVPVHRVRRRALDCDARTTQCCKKSLYISFKMLQWDDWIIAPQGYYANYCMGDCSKRGRTPDQFAKFHTHVIEEYRNRNPYATIQQCCAPSKLAAMSLIYFDQDQNIIKTDLPNMIVDECSCA